MGFISAKRKIRPKSLSKQSNGFSRNNFELPSDEKICAYPFNPPPMQGNFATKRYVYPNNNNKNLIS